MTRARILAEFAAASEQDAGRVRTMTVNSGVPVYRFNMWTGEEYYLQLGMGADQIDISRLAGAPLLKDHNRSVDSVIGSVRAPRLDGGILKAEAHFSTTPDVETIWAKVQDGTLRNVSVEAAVSHREKLKEKLDGLPVYLATKWEPEAVALVPVGADRNAALMSADFGPDDFRAEVKGIINQVLAEAGFACALEDVKRELHRIILRIARR
jgi:hypothetical protein